MKLTAYQTKTLASAKESAKALAAMLVAKGPFDAIRVRGTVRARCLWLLNELAKLETALKRDNPDLRPDEVLESKGLTHADHANVMERARKIRAGEPLDDE